MITRKYNLINNIGGWTVFVIALVTYWLTLEPTASYWDCGEFIIQADKLEVGHPPGNPIFMLTARFFANFAPSAQYVSVMVNAMSGLLSALTILLLFWTITHFTRKLVVDDDDRAELPLRKYLVIMGAGVAGALAYTWSDTFWFSAVEGEVYAFSSFCTALVVWLMLKWENRAEQPGSDRWLILIAYIIGVSIAVHLLNLLCIPALVLVFAYRKFKDMNVKRSLAAILISFAIIVLVLYGLVPGFIKVAQWFELWFVNGMGLPFNSGVMAYTLLTVGLIGWSLYELRAQRSGLMVRVSFLCAVCISGILFIGSGAWLGLILLAALAMTLWYVYRRGLPVRVLNVIMWSIFVIFVGYSSYALILIRSTADTPMNQNSPDNVFALGSYLNREQYGETPLLYGETYSSQTRQILQGYRTDTLGNYPDGTAAVVSTPVYQSDISAGKPMYSKGVKGAIPYSPNGFLTDKELARNMELAERGKDFYALYDHKPEAKQTPETDMLLPRMHSRDHIQAYGEWVNLDTIDMVRTELHAIDAESGEKVPLLDTQAGPQFNEATGVIYYPQKTVLKPSFAQNLGFFINYQLNHMYMRYFMWNFAGRQNDLLNQHGELDAGNWISGIPFIDNPRLGDQSLLPDTLGKGNKGHNVFFMLPLILGLIGLLWQSFAGRRGIEQFWVVFFLFFMTGIAIVLYLNQTPLQPRERDYAFAGSFYAFAIWIGLGVPALWRILTRLTTPKEEKPEAAKTDGAKKEQPAEEPLQSPAALNEPKEAWRRSTICAAVACTFGLFVPLQMVSQTWDDHDRSGRYAARDYAINYLNSLEPNAVIFCNGDNDTFPLWYAQEVEGVRPDVKIVNLSYLSSDWYADQQRMQSYSAAPIAMTAKPTDYAYGLGDVTLVGYDTTPVNLLEALKGVYAGHGRDLYGYPMIDSRNVYIPVDKEAVVRQGLVAPEDTAQIVDRIEIDLMETPAYRRKGYLALGEVLMLDMLATNAANGWTRPFYWASSIGQDLHLGLTPYMRATGMAHQLVPTQQAATAARTDRAYDVVMKKYLWGGADKATAKKAPYFDETAGRMFSATRYSMEDVASQLIYEGDLAAEQGQKAKATDKFRRALAVIDKMEKNLPQVLQPYNVSDGPTVAEMLCELGQPSRLNDKKLTQRGLKLLEDLMTRYAQHIVYFYSARQNHPNASFSIETSYAPIQFYHMAELYSTYGGNAQKFFERPEMRGINLEALRKNWETYNGMGTDEDSGSLEDYEDELRRYAEIVGELQSLPADEYADRTELERQIDSIFFETISYFVEMGGSEEKLMKYPELQKVDMERSRRMRDAFVARHPEMAR